MRALTFWTIIAACIAAALTRYTVAQEIDPVLFQKAQFVFVGTQVQRPLGSTLAPDQGLVRIERVIRMPVGTAVLEGDIATLSGGGDVNDISQQAVFYADVISYGDQLTLAELGRQTPVPEAIDAERAIASAELRTIEEQARNATAVATGRVLSIRDLRTESEEGAVSEHNPAWKEAIVQVVAAVKGVDVGQPIAVRFSASRDIAWFLSPKLQVGQTATFLLRPDHLTKAEPAVVDGHGVVSFLLVFPGSVQSETTGAQLEELLR